MSNESELLKNEMTETDPSWIKLRVIRQRFIIKFDTPFDKKVTEEITLLYDGQQDLGFFDR